MRYGYACATNGDTTQIKALQRFGVDEIYEDSAARLVKRPQLTELLRKLKPGDHLVVWSIDELGKTVKQLLALIEDMDRGGITLVSLTDSLDYPTLRTLIQLEKNIISERVRAGMGKVRDRGRNVGRPPKQKNAVDRALTMYHSNNFTIAEIEEETGVSRTSIYNYLNRKEGETNE